MDETDVNGERESVPAHLVSESVDVVKSRGIFFGGNDDAWFGHGGESLTDAHDVL